MAVVSRQGIELHYSTVGSGPPLAFHTGGGGDGSMWQQAGYPDLLPGHRHLLLDHRGHGKSSRPPSLEQHRLAEYVADVRAVLLAESAAPVTFIGYSDGGYVGCALAAQYPDLVSALVVIGGVAHPDDDPRSRREAAREIRASGLAPAIRQMSEAESVPAPAWFVRNLTDTPDEMFALELEAWADEPNQTAFFDRIRCPVLIVCGEKENVDGSAQIAQQLMPGTEVAVLPGFGHLQVFWNSAVTGPHIARFLQDLRPYPTPLRLGQA